MAKTKLTGTFEEVISDLDTIAEDAVRDMLVRSIEYLVIHSPVDTGAYIESHTLSNTAGAPRSRSARGRKGKSGKPWPMACWTRRLRRAWKPTGWVAVKLNAVKPG